MLKSFLIIFLCIKINTLKVETGFFCSERLEFIGEESLEDEEIFIKSIETVFGKESNKHPSFILFPSLGGVLKDQYSLDFPYVIRRLEAIEGDSFERIYTIAIKNREIAVNSILEIENQK